MKNQHGFRIWAPLTCGALGAFLFIVGDIPAFINVSFQPCPLVEQSKSIAALKVHKIDGEARTATVSVLETFKGTFHQKNLTMNWVVGQLAFDEKAQGQEAFLFEPTWNKENAEEPKQLVLHLTPRFLLFEADGYEGHDLELVVLGPAGGDILKKRMAFRRRITG